MSPMVRRSIVPKVIPLELVLINHIFSSETWNRYFFNEWDRGYVRPEKLEIAKDKTRFPWNLTTEEGKRDFETYVKEYQETCPGVFAPEGQKFDFEKYYKELGV